MKLPLPITSRTNARVKTLRAAFSGKASKPGEMVGLEGENLLVEAMLAGLELDTVFVREGSEEVLERHRLQTVGLQGKNWAVVSREVFDSAVGTVSPQGIAATWLIQEPPAQNAMPNVLIVEGLQDPGNLGTLIRSGFAFGFSKFMVTPETVNHWNPKVIRAAAGANFHVQVVRLPLVEIMAHMQSEGVRTFAAVAGFHFGRDYGYPVLAAPHGVLTGRIDNANAPAGSRYPDVMSPPVDAEPARRYAASFCRDTDFTEPCAILIGNEGAGLSQQARQLADEQVSIPSSAESLNAAVAGSVLMYESMRQLLLRRWARKQGLRP